MKRYKKLFAVLLTIVAVFSLTAVSASATSEMGLSKDNGSASGYSWDGSLFRDGAHALGEMTLRPHSSGYVPPLYSVGVTVTISYGGRTERASKTETSEEKKPLTATVLASLTGEVDIYATRSTGIFYAMESPVSTLNA